MRATVATTGVLLLATACGARSALDDDGRGSGGPGGLGTGAAGNAGAAGQAPGGEGPEPVISLHESGLNLAVGAGRVYWTSDQGGGVLGCDIGSCAASLLEYAAYPDTTPYWEYPHGIAVDEESIYWANEYPGAVVRCPIGGCGDSPTVVADGLNSPNGVAVDASHVYWTAYGDAGVFRCPKTGCSGAPENVALNQDSPLSLALDESDVFFVCAGPSGAIVRAAKDGSGWEVVAEEQNQPVSVAVDAGYVYWTTGWAFGSVLRCPKTGCSAEPEVLASNQQNPWSIAVDGSHVFWTGKATDSGVGPNADGLVLRCPVTGCGTSPTTIASEQSSAWGESSIALDSTHVYWVTTGQNDPVADGVVMRAPKQ